MFFCYFWIFLKIYQNIDQKLDSNIKHKKDLKKKKKKRRKKEGGGHHHVKSKELAPIIECGALLHLRINDPEVVLVMGIGHYIKLRQALLAACY